MCLYSLQKVVIQKVFHEHVIFFEWEFVRYFTNTLLFLRGIPKVFHEHVTFLKGNSKGISQTCAEVENFFKGMLNKFCGI